MFLEGNVLPESEDRKAKRRKFSTAPCPSSGFGDCLAAFLLLTFDRSRKQDTAIWQVPSVQTRYMTCTMGFEACCLFFAASPVEDDDATLVWSPAAAFSSRKGQKAKKSQDASSTDAANNANSSSTNPTKDLTSRAFEGRDEEVTLHSYLSSMDDADESSRNNDEEAEKEQEAGGAPSSSSSAETPSAASALAQDIAVSAEAAVKEAQRAAADFERTKRERAIASEFERRRAERAAEREKQALEREVRQRKEKEEADKKRRLASRAAFEERRKEAEELKRKREDAKRRREQQQVQAPFQPQQYHLHHHHNVFAQSTPGIGEIANPRQQQYQHMPHQQMHQSHHTPQKPYNPQPQPQSQPQTWARSQPQSTSPPTNAQYRAKAAPTSPQPTQHRPKPQKIPSSSTSTSTPAKTQASAMPGSTQSTEEVKRSILIAWALEPPNYQQLKPIATMIANLQVVLPPSFGVKSHEYFAKWKPISYHDICQNEEALKKAVRKCRFFLHPDKLPSDLDEVQSFVCKMIWDVMNDAWESHKTGVPV